MLRVWLCREPTLAGDPHGLRGFARALRDAVLAEALGCDVSALRFAADEHGKPLLVAPSGWHFNLSHSGDAVALALGPTPLGVDLEPGARRARWDALARRQFHAAEYAALQNLSQPSRRRQAVALWTAKEAWAKATGLGVARMAAAPCFAGGATGWRLPAGHADGFVQVTWQAMVIGVYTVGQPAPAPQWQEVRAEAGASGWSFAVKDADTVAEFSA